jgi:hypothetical protein
MHKLCHTALLLLLWHIAFARAHRAAQWRLAPHDQTQQRGFTSPAGDGEGDQAKPCELHEPCEHT